MSGQSNPIGLMLKKGFARFKTLGGVIIGLMDANGDDVTAAEMNWATFSNPVLTNPADYAGIVVRVTDRHRDPRGYGGVYFIGGTQWTLISEEIYYATFDLAPDPAAWPQLPVCIGNLNNAKLRSNGSAYRLRSKTPFLLAAGFELAKSTGSPNIYTEEALLSCVLPINNGKSILQNGDRIAVKHHVKKTGVADRIARSIRFGPNATHTSNTAFDAITTSSAANTRLDEEAWSFLRINSTNIKKEGATPAFNGGIVGINALGNSANVAVSNMDSALQYLALTYNLFSGGGTDTAMMIESAAIYIEHLGA